MAIRVEKNNTTDTYYTLSQKCPNYILNNSMKSEAMLMIFGTQNPK